MKKIVVTGAESTGKTTLSKSLANHFNSFYIPEFSRIYLEKLNRPYIQEDLLTIAKGQLNLECQAQRNGQDIIICDTSLMVMKVWSEYKYDYCDPWILEQIENQNWNLFLLPHYDIPYEEDPLRENPSERDILFELYYLELSLLGIPFIVLEGTENERKKLAIKAIDSLLNLNE